MSQLIFAVKFGCDICGKEADSPDRTTLTGSNAAPPPGWTDLYSSHLVLQTPHGMPLMHVCEDCGKIPIVNLPAVLAEAAERKGRPA
jgi:hypothetical protein